MSLSKANSRSRPSEDWPVPKSSSETRMPTRFRSSTIFSAEAGSVIRPVSVISISSRRGSKPVLLRIDRICRPVFWSTSCDGDRLNDRNMSSGQLRAASVALRSTSCASGPMMPRSSAIGMKVAGETKPRSRSVQRASASKPMVRRVFRSTIGWKCGSTSPAATARRSCCSMRVTCLAACSISRVNTTTRPRPERLAW